MSDTATPTPLLTAAQILAAPDQPRRRVEVPEWGGAVMVKTMTGAERGLFEKAMYVGRGRTRELNHELFRAKLAAAVVCDEAGRPLFTEADVPALAAKSVKALDRVLAVASELNAISAEDVEDLVGESSADRS